MYKKRQRINYQLRAVKIDESEELMEVSLILFCVVKTIVLFC